MTEAGKREWAAAHYRVERDSTGLKASRRKLKRIAEEAARFGDPLPEQAHDVIRIFDREGDVVMERDWGTNREAALAEEARIIEDLLHLDVLQFRAKYGIPFEGVPEGPRPGEDAAAGVEGKPEGASG